MAPLKVIVVGGGLAGALLANGLQNNDVKVRVYERDERNIEREGYKNRLGESAMLGFRACLKGPGYCSNLEEFRSVLGFRLDGTNDYEFSLRRDP